MTKFADELFADLMQEHGSALEVIPPPARRTVPRPVWLAAGVVGMAGAITAGVTVLSGGTPAYAVTDNADGTVTVAINQLSGVDGANGALRSRGDRVVVVPVRDGCPTLDSLPPGRPGSSDHPTQVSGSASGHGGTSGTITVDAHGVPAGDTALVAVQAGPNGIRVAMKLISGPAPRCVSGLPAQPPARSGSGSGGGVVGSGGNSGGGQVSGH